MAIVRNYTSFGGSHPETAAIRNVLAAGGLKAPHTGAPFTEAMILGIGGGLGAGYILWEFQEHQMKALVVAFRKQWQYTMDWYQSLADRLGLRVAMPETGSRKTAAQTLNEALDRDQAVVAWVDRAGMPYLQLPEAMKGHLGHIVAVCGREHDGYVVDDLAVQPFMVDGESMAETRGRIGSFKNRLVVVESLPASIDLPAAIRIGLQDCADHLSSTSDSFSLPTIRKWAKTMTDSKHKKGWPKVFADRRGLFSTLTSVFEEIELSGSPGGLRGLYADFLIEAAGVLGVNRLNDPAEHYRALAEQWHSLAEEALPDDVPLFRETKALLRQRDRIIKQGGDKWRESTSITGEIAARRREGNLNLPLNDAEVMDLFTALQTRLNSIYQAEVGALKALKAAIGLQ